VAEGRSVLFVRLNLVAIFDKAIDQATDGTIYTSVQKRKVVAGSEV